MELTKGKNRVEFLSVGSKIIGNLYYPDDFDESKTYPAIVTAGPLGTVKEQAAGVFAEKLAKKGFISLAFDFRTQGESEGSPKNYENPFNKAEDIQNAISFLNSLTCVDKGKIGAFGICAGGSYTMHAIVSDRRIKAYATVNPYFSLREFAGYNPMITDEVRDMLLKRSNDARQHFFETENSENADILLPDAKTAEELPIPGEDGKDVFDYYFTRVDTCWPNYSSRFATMSYESLVKSQALDHAKDLTIPYLGIVGSEAFTKTYTERFIAEIPHDNKEMKVIDGARHVQTYDVEEYVDEAVTHIDSFFKTNLY